MCQHLDEYLTKGWIKLNIYCRRFWAVILSQAVWKRSWAGCDPTQSKMAVDRIVATTGIEAWAQLLTA